ncbi:hypothetical protein Tco_0720771 [Tanacetum coccineum]
MSSASSAVTYTSVYTNFEPGRVFWGADKELSDEGPEHPPSPIENNMPPKRSSTAARAAATAATPITAAAVKQLIKARVSAALTNHETLRNSTNGHGDESHNSETRIRGTVRTPFKFATCTFLGNALTWWNSYMKTVTQDVAYAMD